MHRFKIFACIKYRDLEPRVRGHSRSFEMTSFDRSHLTLVGASRGLSKNCDNAMTPTLI